MITVVSFSNGERYPMRVDLDGQPDYWVTMFTTAVLRSKDKATTIENSLRHIEHFKFWEQIEGRDILSEISEGSFPCEADISAIRDHCMLDKHCLKKWVDLKPDNKVTKLSALYSAPVKTLDVVSKSHFAQRVTVIAAFLDFTARAMLQQRADFSDLLKKIASMKGALLALKQKVSGYSKRSNDPDLKAPPPAVFNQLMDVVQVGVVNNPFKHLGVQKRNKLLLDVMRETGMRSGEVLALKLEDIDYLIHTIEVVRRHDDVSDTRKRQPVAKTLGRELKISKELVYQLREYIMTIRSKIDGANKHSFVFVTHKKGEYSGQPLSDSSFRLRILGAATLTFPDLFTEINRHGFRHNFNYVLSQKIDAHNKAAETDPKIKAINEKQETQIRKRLNGWLSDNTAIAYNLRHIKEKANELMLEDMQRQASFTKKGVN